MQQYETITMPDAGIGSFLTSNIDEIDDNELLFGNAGGINSMKEVADRMAAMGNGTDTYIIHASEKEIMLPREVAERNPELVGQIKQAIASEGADPEAYVVGSASNSINPMTGQREFLFKKLVRGIKKVFKKAAKIILPVAALALTSGAGIPFLGAAGTAAVASGVGSLIQGESFKDALKSAAIAGLGTGIVGGISSGVSAVASGTGTFGSGFAQGAIGTLPGGLQTGAKNLFGIGEAAAAPQAFDTVGRINELTASGLAESNATTIALQEAKIANAAAAAGGKSSLVSTAFKYGLPSLLAAGSMGAFDEIPAEEITEIAGTDITDMSDPSNPLADPLKIIEENPEDYLIGQPGETNFMTPTQQAVYSGQPVGAASYNPIVPSTTYANLIPTGAGTNNMMGAMVPSSGGFATYVPPPPVKIPSYQPPIYQYDNLVTAAKGGAMNFPRRTGQIEGPGTETSDDIPAMLSDGEFVMTAKAVKNAGGGSREQGFRKMYDIMRSFEGGAVA